MSSDAQFEALAQKVRADTVRICCDPHGTRAMQKLIERAANKLEHIAMIAQLLGTHIKQLTEDINGNHVVQKILFTFKAPHNQFIFDTMVTKCVAIACHKHGCCVMQKCIDGASA